MKNFLKSKIATIGILIATLVLAGVAVFTAIRLYQLRQEAVAPNVPSSKPKAAEPVSCSAITFNLPTATPGTVACNEACGGTPGTVCSTGLTCFYNGSTTPPNPVTRGVCRNPECKDETDCLCPGETPTPTPTTTATPTGTGTATPTSTATATPTGTGTATPTSTATAKATGTATAAPSLPDSGTSWPTVLGVGAGAIIIFFSLLLAL